MDDLNKNPDEVIEDELDDNSEDNNDGDEQSMEDLIAELAREREEKENLKKALKETREKAKIKPQTGQGNKADDIDSRVERILKENSLREKYNGEDGLPKFNRAELVEYADEMGLDYNKIDTETLYKLKYQDEVTEATIKGALRANKGVVTADGKPVSVATLKKRIESANSPQELAELMGLND